MMLARALALAGCVSLAQGGGDEVCADDQCQAEVEKTDAAPKKKDPYEGMGPIAKKLLGKKKLTKEEMRDLSWESQQMLLKRKDGIVRPPAAPEAVEGVGQDPAYFGRGIPPWRLAEHVRTYDFDPTSKEGELFHLAGMDTLDEVFMDRRMNLDTLHPGLDTRSAKFWEKKLPLPSKEGDAAPVEDTIKALVDGFMEGAETHHGMRSFRAAVLGAGDLKGVPLGAFKEPFQEVICADVSLQDTMSAVAAAAQRWPREVAKVQYRKEDLVGLIASFRWKVEYLMGVVEDPQEALDEIAKWIESDDFYPKHWKHDTKQNATMRYVAGADVIILNQLLGELGKGFEDHMFRELNRLRGKGTGGTYVKEISATLKQKTLFKVTPTLQRKVAARFGSLLKERIAGNPNRKLIILLSNKGVRVTQTDAAGVKIGEAKAHPTRSVVSDAVGLAAVRALGKKIHGEEAVMATRRYAVLDAEGKPKEWFVEEETVWIMAIQVGEKDISFEEYIKRVKEGTAVVH